MAAKLVGAATSGVVGIVELRDTYISSGETVCNWTCACKKLNSQSGVLFALIVS